MPYVIDPDKCIACASCASVCPVEAPIMGKTGSYFIQTDTCIECGSCVEECPVQAITEQKDPE